MDTVFLSYITKWYVQLDFTGEIWIFVRGDFNLIFSMYVNGRSSLLCLVSMFSVELEHFYCVFYCNIVQNV